MDERHSAEAFGMTQPSRTTETVNRDYAAMREIMHKIQALTVPDRATIAVGLLGHLATMMNRAQMEKLMAQLIEEVARVQDVPPKREHTNHSRARAQE
jgi:hypothetical protein